MAIETEEAIGEVGPLLWTLHLHDNNGDGDFHLSPGKGNIDWVAVANALAAVSYSGVLNLELSPGDWKSDDAWNAVKEGVSFLGRVFE